MSEERPCILVVEDDAAAARMLELTFRARGLRVVVQARAFGVLEAIARERPVVVVMDVMMPGLDGPSLVELVRDDPELAPTPIVLWSAMDPAELERRARLCGADAFAEKTAGPRALLDHLSGWLDAAS